MSTALIIRERNPDDDFVLHGRPPPTYNDRKSFYPTNSDITTTTRNLSQHDYRAELYRDVLTDDPGWRHSLRSAAHSLQLVSDDIQKNLDEGGTGRNYLQSRYGRLTYRDDAATSPAQQTATSTKDRGWLADSEWNTSSGHYVAFEDGARRTTLLNRSPTLTLRQELLDTPAVGNELEADRLRRSVNVDMNLAQVPETRFTRKDLMASEFFPVTMSYSGSEDAGSPRSCSRRSRSRTRSPDRLAQSARLRATPLTDNFRSMKRLEKLYLVTSEAPSVASAPHAVVSPYAQEISQLRMARLKLEEAHLNELNRLTTLERVRGPKPKWYELKDTQFHFEAGKNNELVRTQDRWESALKSRSFEMSQSQPDLSTLHMRAASFS